MSRFVKSRRLAILVAVGLVVAVVAVAWSFGLFGIRPAGTTPFPAQRSPDPASGTPPAAADQTAYEGPLGDFLVGIHQGSSGLPCPRPFRPAKNEKIKASELYSPVFGDNLEGFVVECADGKIVLIEIYGPEIIGRGYFVGRPVVPYEVPLQRLRLLTVAGKPAIAQLPSPGFAWTLRLAVIEWPSRGDQPGILVSIEDTNRTIEEAAELAARIMGVRP